MKLEESIKQKAFKDDYHKAVVNISYTHYWLLQKERTLLKPYDISLQQFNVLRILRGQRPHPATVQLIKERMLDKSSDASRLIERLRTKGLVERKECPGDRRAVDVFITAKGLKILDEIDGRMPLFHKQFKKNLSEKEAQQLNDLLDKLRGNEE